MTGTADATPCVYLIACVSQKLDLRAPAADLYRSDWFRKARTYVEETGERWFILSAAHGLVKPSQRLAPYDATLRDLTAAERRLWGEKTTRQLRRAIGTRHAGPIVFLAGRLYREPLLAFAGDRAIMICILVVLSVRVDALQEAVGAAQLPAMLSVDLDGMIVGKVSQDRSARVSVPAKRIRTKEACDWLDQPGKP